MGACHHVCPAGGDLPMTQDAIKADGPIVVVSELRRETIERALHYVFNPSCMGTP
jgi:hypothetical protein